MPSMKINRETFIDNYDKNRDGEVDKGERAEAGKLFDAVDVASSSKTGKGEPTDASDGVVDESDFVELAKRHGDPAVLQGITQPFARAAVRAGAHLVQQGKLQEAKPLLERIAHRVEISPSQAIQIGDQGTTDNATWNLGSIANAEQRWGDAAKLFGEVYRANPKDTQARFLEQQAIGRAAWVKAGDDIEFGVEVVPQEKGGGTKVNCPSLGHINRAAAAFGEMLKLARRAGGDFHGSKVSDIEKDIGTLHQMHAEVVDTIAASITTPDKGVASWAAKTKASANTYFENLLRSPG